MSAPVFAAGRGKYLKTTTPPDSEYEEFLLQVIEGQAVENKWLMALLARESSALGQALVRIRELEGNPVSVLAVLEAAGGFD